MTPRILVIGATGLLGESVARCLQQAGFTLRLMSRRAGRAGLQLPRPAETFLGDALKRTDLEQALAGCDAVHISIDHDREDECVARVVEVARARQLKRITYVSGTTVCQENRWFPLVNRKMRSEQAIVAGGMDYTIFCPGWFMEMLGRLVRGGRIIMFGTPRRRWHMVAVRDFARMVTESYRRPQAVNRRFYVHGPQALTVPEAVEAYCRALHPEIRTTLHTPIWLARLVARLRRSPEMRAGVDMMAYLETVGERGDPCEANAVLGAPRVTLDQWLMAQEAARRL